MLLYVVVLFVVGIVFVVDDDVVVVVVVVAFLVGLRQPIQAMLRSGRGAVVRAILNICSEQIVLYCLYKLYTSLLCWEKLCVFSCTEVGRL